MAWSRLGAARPGVSHRTPSATSHGHLALRCRLAYRRPPGDRLGGYFVRLNGLFQFKESARRGNLKADVVVDLRTTVRPA